MVQNPIQTRHGRKGILPSLNWKSASSYSRTGPVTPVMMSGVPEKRAKMSPGWQFNRL